MPLPWLGLWALLLRAAAGFDCPYSPDNATCVINGSVRTVGGDTLLWTKGDVVVTDKASIGVTGDLVINATGGCVKVLQSAVLSAKDGNLRLIGKCVQVSSDEKLGAPSLVAEHSVDLRATCGGVQVAGLLGESAQDAGVFPSLNSTLVSVTANGTSPVDIAAWLHPASSLSIEPMPELRVSGADVLTLGPTKSLWRLSKLEATANSIQVNRQNIRTQGNSCNNKQASKVNVCDQLLAGQEPAGDLSFDFSMVASSSLTVEFSSIYAGSTMMCSGDKAELRHLAKIDASGHGCPAGKGSGSGSWPGGARCGAGGGSNLGEGGHGAHVDSGSQVRECASPGRAFEGSLEVLLPTEGASGGGCGDNKNWCRPQDEGAYPNAAGGGLVWVSAKDLSMSTGAMLLADGLPGGPARSGTSTSGGGSGGQVVVFAGTLSVTDWPSVGDNGLPVLSAVGGDTGCMKETVSGAGGGGVVVFGSWNNPAPVTQDAGKLSVLVHGGKMAKPCEQYVPESDGRITYGQAGVAVPFQDCGPGFAGMLCQPCDVGTWSAGGMGSQCARCTNKPPSALAKYVETRWPNSSCAYVCDPSVPFVAVNKKCLDVPGFFFDFFGGTWGVLTIFLTLVALSGLLLCRSRQAKRRSAEPEDTPARAGASFHHNHFRALISPALLVAQLRRRLAPCERRARLCAGAPVMEEGDFNFTKEHLPFHACRVHLSGSNQSGDPWVLPPRLAESLSPEVSVEGWRRLASEIELLAAVPRSEAIVQRCLGMLYPPVAPLHGRWRRGQRALRVKRLASSLSQGSNFWRPARASLDAEGELTVCFGWDSGATLGFLDFFNFSRSRLDWAPVDLRRQARLLAARGHGTHAEPLAVDSTDPLIEDLMQTDLGREAVCDVIVTFNTASRLICQEELSLPTPSETTMQLRSCVKHCAALRGLEGHVHVVKVVAEGREGLSNASSPTGALQASTAEGGLFSRSFSDLVQRQPASVVRPAGSAGDRRPQAKLCLAFADAAASTGASSAALAAPVPTLRLPHLGALTSPMACVDLWEQLSWESSRPEAPLIVGSLYDASSLSSRFLARVLVWREGYKADVVLLALVFFLAADMLSFVLIAASLLEVNVGVLFAWLLVPPLAQPAALALGIGLLITNEPWAGHLFVAFNACSMVNACVATLGLFLILQLQSWLFLSLTLVGVIAVKFGLCVVAGMHTANVEAARDRAQLSGATASGTMASGHIASERHVPHLHHVDSEDSLHSGGGSPRRSSSRADRPIQAQLSEHHRPLTPLTPPDWQSRNSSGVSMQIVRSQQSPF